MKKIIFFIILALVIFIVTARFLSNEDTKNPVQLSENVKIITPQPNEIISSPLKIEGGARGIWFFEASFPVRLFDANNQEIAVAISQAQGDWMTTDFVPFKATLKFAPPATDKGILVLEKDNPSGLPENAEEFKIPVFFSQERTKVKAFFNNDRFDPEISCNKVFPVEREIFATPAVARAALEELLKGPNTQEKPDGYFTNINANVKIQKLTIENGIAKVDFDEQLEYQMGGSCRVAAIRAQITQTLKQFSTVQEVIISVNGRTEDILQP